MILRGRITISFDRLARSKKLVIGLNTPCTLRTEAINGTTLDK